MADIHLLGIRHHGPGSCRNVLEALEKIQPDLILLEGPPETEALIPFVADVDMKPPVALLAYQSDAPQNAVFYPFASFSPEWMTLCHALKKNITIRFFDLPLTHSLAMNHDNVEALDVVKPVNDIPADPFDLLAEVSGYPNGEAWWNMNIEQRKDSSEIFDAVKEAVTALRDALPEHISSRDEIREAWMRRMIRAAQKESFERIAVVCGAWHIPALEKIVKVKDDNDLLKGLPKVKVECTWIPWTYSRLSLKSGYGAGIASPGWYDYQWHHPDDDGTLWVSKIAALLREKNMDVSVAHVIETVRLAQATAALRGMPFPTLEEYNEAVTAIMGFGDDMLLQLVKEEVLVGNSLGKVPDKVPKVPLLSHIERLQKRLRIPFIAEIKEVILDLRKENDLERSFLFHRLSLLDIDWASPVRVEGKGTFKEKWMLCHKPEQIVCIIERAIWGNTVDEATQQYVAHKMSAISSLTELTALLSSVIPANLPQLMEAMTLQLDRLSAASTDIVEMMKSIPDLVSIVRYGDVRDLDFSKVESILRAMVARIMAGGLLACTNIDEEQAENMFECLFSTNYAVATLNDDELSSMWNDFLFQIHHSSCAHPLLSGYATRMLYDKDEVSHEGMQNTLSFYSSVGNSSIDIAFWLEGFLHGSGSILLLDDHLWQLVNKWLCELSEESFLNLLPLIRRTFSNFTTAERRKLGEKAKGYTPKELQVQNVEESAYNREDASKVIPLLTQLLGMD